MKKQKTILVVTGLIGMLILTLGCEKDNPVDPGGGGTVDPTENTLIFSTTEIDFQSGYLHDNIILMQSMNEQTAWRVDTKPSWVELTGREGILVGDRDQDTIRVVFNPESLPFGTHEGRIEVRSDAGDGEIIVSVEHVPGELEFQLPILTFDRKHLTDDLTVTNLGTEPTWWRLDSKPEWIQVDRDSGWVLDRSQVIHVEAVPWGMAYGQYDGTLNFTSSAGPYEVTVHLTHERMVEIFPAEEAGGLKIGDTYSELQTKFGNEHQRAYKLVEVLVSETGRRYLKETGMFSLSYSWGLTGRFFTNFVVLDPVAAVDWIEVTAPYDGITEDNLGIGSTRDAVVAVYGEPDLTGTNETIQRGEEVYESGIAFTYDASGLVTHIRVFDPADYPLTL